MHITILTWIQNGGINGFKIVAFQKVVLKLNFEVEDYLYINCDFHILVFQCKSFHF